jgi:hypothetical protein
MEEEEEAGARKRRGKHFSAATNQHATLGELLKVVLCAVRAEVNHLYELSKCYLV